MHDVLVLAAHPDLARSRLHSALLDALQAARRGGAVRWTLHDLYAPYPDDLIDVAAEQAAAAGKDPCLVISTSGTEASCSPQGHTRHFIDAFRPPYEQTAALCGTRFLPPAVPHGAHRAADSEISAHSEVITGRLLRHPDWPEFGGLPPCVVRPVEAGERPR